MICTEKPRLCEEKNDAISITAPLQTHRSPHYTRKTRISNTQSLLSPELGHTQVVTEISSYTDCRDDTPFIWPRPQTHCEGSPLAVRAEAHVTVQGTQPPTPTLSFLKALLCSGCMSLCKILPSGQ